MLWLSDTDWAYVFNWRDGSSRLDGLWSTGGNAWRWDGSFENGRGLTPPPGLFEPIRGFGFVWFNFLGGPTSQIGWATDQEKGFCATVQRFEHGLIWRSSTVATCQDDLYNWATDPSFEPLFFVMQYAGRWQRY